MVGIALTIAACAGTWTTPPIETYRPSGAAPPASVCMPCHEPQVATWKKNRHSDEKAMERIPLAELRECGACHEGLAAHVAEPGTLPAKAARMTKSEKNMLCGKCHFSQKLFGWKAIDPHGRHALFANVALEGQTKQIACLDCHSGHHGGADMLVRIKAHICFECHTTAIVTMGIFQPFNYLTFGKMCQACHTVHGGSASERWGRMGVGFCVICHFVGVAIVGGS
jgi:predicted CXXCH cytochrome family protein